MSNEVQVAQVADQVKRAVGIEELWDVLSAVIHIANGIDAANEDGKIDAIEIVTVVVGASLPILDAIQGGELIPAELKDLDEAEQVELVNRVKSAFDLRDDNAEEFIEDVFRAASVVFQVVSKHFLGNEEVEEVE